jgi:hypothetical protein
LEIDGGLATIDNRRNRVDLLLRVVILILWANLWKLQTQEVCTCQDSVEGMNFDFVAMNLTGFTFYSIYCSYGYFVNTDQTGQVDLNDLLFAYHALFATLLTLTQVMFFPKKNNKVHAITLCYLILLWSFCIVYAILTQVFFISI